MARLFAARPTLAGTAPAKQCTETVYETGMAEIA
jgi:hypothetical protein